MFMISVEAADPIRTTFLKRVSGLRQPYYAGSTPHNLGADEPMDGWYRVKQLIGTT